jgi:hypothetical protein
VKKSIDAAWAAKAKARGAERPPDAITWADLIAMAGIAATILEWGGSPDGGFPVRQGREDTSVADPEGRFLPLAADAAAAKAWFKKRGIKLAAAVPVWMAVTDNAESAMVRALTRRCPTQKGYASASHPALGPNAFEPKPRICVSIPHEASWVMASA